MYSNGSNTAQKLESLEKKVGNLQETVNYIQPMPKQTMRPMLTTPYTPISVNSTEPLESMVYKQPVAKKAARAPTAEESRADAATTQAVSIMEKYMDNMKLGDSARGSDQRQGAFDMIYNAILEGRPVPSFDDVMSAIDARPAPQVPAVQIRQPKAAKVAGKPGQRYEPTPEELEAALASDRISEKTKSIFDEYTRNIPRDERGKMQANQGRQRTAYDMIYDAVSAGRPVPSQSDVIDAIGVTPTSEVQPRFAAKKAPLPQMIQQQYNNSGQNQSYMQQPLVAAKAGPRSFGYAKALQNAKMAKKLREEINANMEDLPPQALTKMPPLISTYQPPQPINCDKEVIASLLGFTTPILSQIQSDVEKLISPLNKLVLSVGEADITTKGVTKKAASVRAPIGGSQQGGKSVKRPSKKAPRDVIKKAAKKINGPQSSPPRISEVQEGVKEISATITARLAALQRGIQAVSSHLPCEPCDSSGPTEGGSRMKKSIKTRRNRRL